MDARANEGPKRAHWAEGRCLFGLDRAKTGAAEDATVYEVLPKAKFHHQVRAVVQGGQFDQRFVGLRGMARDWVRGGSAA